jgi:molybdenum cofactor biosynthesis enzyme MoaA
LRTAFQAGVAIDLFIALVLALFNVQDGSNMASASTPNLNFITEAQIDEMRSKRKKTKFKGCTQLYQYFIKADGMMACSCMRYWDILADMRAIDAGTFYHGPMIQFIRESFEDGYEPFSVCAGCASRLTNYDHAGTKYDFIDLHIEPSNDCNLFCEACICTFERFSPNVPPRVLLNFELYEKTLREIHAAGLKVRHLALVGFGEPMFHGRIPEMAQLGRELFPDAFIFVDTNANFGKRRAIEVASCGISEIRLALDGVDQDSYVAYRRNGEFDKALQFTKELAQAVRETGSATRVLWKYILFSHNDKDEQILKAMLMAREIGIPIVFDATVGANASKRSREEIKALVGAPIGCNIDPQSTEGTGFQLEDPKEGTPLWKRLTRLSKRSQQGVA